MSGYAYFYTQDSGYKNPIYETQKEKTYFYTDHTSNQSSDPMQSLNDSASKYYGQDKYATHNGQTRQSEDDQEVNYPKNRASKHFKSRVQESLNKNPVQIITFSEENLISLLKCVEKIAVEPNEIKGLAKLAIDSKTEENTMKYKQEIDSLLKGSLKRFQEYTNDKQLNILESTQIQIKNKFKEICKEDSDFIDKYKQAMGEQVKKLQNDLGQLSPDLQKIVKRFSSQGRGISGKQTSQFFKEIRVDDIQKQQKTLDTYDNNVGQAHWVYNKEQNEAINKPSEHVDKIINGIYQSQKKYLEKIPNLQEERVKEVLKYYNIPDFANKTKAIPSDLKFSPMRLMMTMNELDRLRQDSLVNDNMLEVYGQYLKKVRLLTRKSGEGMLFVLGSFFFQEMFVRNQIKTLEGKEILEQFYPLEKLFDSKEVDRFGFVVNVDSHSSRHWVFLGVFNQTREIVYYDSLDSSQNFQLLTPALEKFLLTISKVKYTSRKYQKIPRQENGYDCGMFVLKYMQNFAYGKEQVFTQKDINKFRNQLYNLFPAIAYQQDQNKFQLDFLQSFEEMN